MSLLYKLSLLMVLLPVLAAANERSSTPRDAQRALDAPPGVVDGKTARALAAAGAVIVDVRTPQEFATNGIPGAKNIPYDQIRARAAEIGGPATPVLLYCRTGRRSAIAASALQELGFKKVWDMQTVERWTEGR